MSTPSPCPRPCPLGVHGAAEHEKREEMAEGTRSGKYASREGWAAYISSGRTLPPAARPTYAPTRFSWGRAPGSDAAPRHRLLAVGTVGEAVSAALISRSISVAHSTQDSY